MDWFLLHLSAMGNQQIKRITFKWSYWFQDCLTAICEIDGESIFCYDFTITSQSYKTVVSLQFLYQYKGCYLVKIDYCIYCNYQPFYT